MSYIKEQYYKLTKTDFDKKLSDIRNDDYVYHFFNNEYFYFPSTEIVYNILAINRLQWDFDNLLNSFSNFAKKQIIQSFLIEEIQSTNSIENIYSTKKDIFNIINNISSSNNKRILSIAKSYKMLLSSNVRVNNVEDVKKIYDELTLGATDNQNILDGELFRKKEVVITNGLKVVHKGFYPEEKIIDGLKEFINLFNGKKEVYEKLILSHFLFETIHPFYDGNGRTGRFLFSLGLYNETGSALAFLISRAFNNEKSKYYKAFQLGRDIHEFGSLESYFCTISEIIMKEFEIFKNELVEKKKLLNDKSFPSLTKSEEKIYNLLKEATIFSNYGVSNEEIILYTNSSRRTLCYALKKFELLNLLEDQRIGSHIYHKLKS